VDALDKFRAAAEAAGGQLLSFEVPVARVHQLQDSLQTRFERQISEGQIDNPVNELSLVKDDQTYSVLHNSNHELADTKFQKGCTKSNY
jgi:hypothetical protein